MNAIAPYLSNKPTHKIVRFGLHRSISKKQVGGSEGDFQTKNWKTRLSKMPYSINKRHNPLI